MLPLIPLISLAAGLVPDLIGLFGGKRAGEVAGKVADVVREITGTTDPAEASALIKANPAEAARLQVRLEEIKQNYVRLQLQDAQDERRSLLETLQAEIVDRARASTAMVSALRSHDWAGRLVAIAPAIVSAAVVVGFFVFTGWMVRQPPPAADPSTLALLNVVVGALVAGFTAVINFWLGSSQGSRDKDQAVAALQQAQSAQVAQAARDVRTASFTAAATAAKSPATHAGDPLPGVPSRFELCFVELLEKEGGFSYHPADPGGPTNMGITQATLAAWRHVAVTADDVATMKREEACEIYRANYWNVLRCDDLPRGVDLMVFDFGVNAGPATSARMLQRAAGAEPDGAIGALTLRAVRANDPRMLVEALATARLEFYRKLDTWDSFGKGWERRTQAIRAKALAMAVA